MKSLNSSLLKAAIFLGIFAFFISCKQEDNTLAKVRVLNEQNQPVSDAEVTLFPNPSPPLGQMVDADVGYTDSDGWIIFDYTDDFDLGTAGFRLLDIKAEKDGLVGSGIIKIIEEEENIESVIISLP